MAGKLHGGMWWAVALVCATVGLIPLFVSGNHEAVDADRISADVATIATEPHPLGSLELDQVRVDIERMLEDAGLEPIRQEFDADDYFGVPSNDVVGVNLLARIEGIEANRAIVFVAHYDSVPTTPGANDNAAAVAALIEMARTIERPPPNDVILLFTDGEEPAPRYGANAFTQHPWFGDVALAVNFEAIGSSGRSLLAEVSGHTNEMVNHLSGAVSDAVAYSFVTDLTAMMGEIGTDFDVFADHGIPGYHFAYLRGSSIYHTPRDNLENLNATGASDHSVLALGIASAPVPDLSVSSDAPGLFLTLPWGSLLIVDPAWATVLTLVAVIAVGSSLAIRWRRRDTSGKHLAGSVGLTVLGFIGSVAVATAAWTAIVSARPTMHATESYIWLSLVLALVAALRWVTERRGSDRLGGTMVIWALVAVVATPAIPGLGLSYSVPLILAALVALLVPSSNRWANRALRIIPVALAIGVLVSPTIEVFFHFATPRPGNPDSELVAAIAVPVAFAYLAFSLLAALMEPAPSEGT